MIHSRVGATGPPLREIIAKTITPEMHRAIFQKYWRLPKDNAGRGVGEPGPASGVAASAGRGGHPLAPRAASGPARGSPLRLF